MGFTEIPKEQWINMCGMVTVVLQLWHIGGEYFWKKCFCVKIVMSYIFTKQKLLKNSTLISWVYKLGYL